MSIPGTSHHTVAGCYYSIREEKAKGGARYLYYLDTASPANITPSARLPRMDHISWQSREDEIQLALIMLPT
jgi:hypothetical protein